jgi:glycosyltransferase involved in cell wall biosynthesis
MYRPHRFLRSFHESLPPNCGRGLLLDGWNARDVLFHGLNQRLPQWRARFTVTTFHDLFVMTGEYSSSEFRDRFARLARDAAARSDRIITVSQFTARQVHELLGVEWDRLRVIHHGVRRRPGSPVRREPIVLHVGAIQKRKNVERLIEAFSTMPAPWTLILAGSAGYGADAILAKATARVRITGYLTNEQLADLYRRASIFAFPSLDEGFGMPVLEAMIYGIPVLSSNTSALPEVCGDAAILVDPTNTDQIASELRRLATEETVREDYIARGLARAKLFGWDVASEKTWSVYKELLG